MNPIRTFITRPVFTGMLTLVLIVFGVVIVMAVFLWLVDLVLLEIVKAVTGQGG